MLKLYLKIEWRISENKFYYNYYYYFYTQKIKLNLIVKYKNYKIAKILSCNAVSNYSKNFIGFESIYKVIKQKTLLVIVSIMKVSILRVVYFMQMKQPHQVNKIIQEEIEDNLKDLPLMKLLMNGLDKK